jgi:exopolysaccharide biosynthesis polyprenyl glycosylphosphotransferase
VKKREIIAGSIIVVFDFASVFIAWYLAYLIRPITDLIPYVHSFFPSTSLPPLDFFFIFTFFSAVGLAGLFAFLGLYKIDEDFKPFRNILQIIFGVFLWGMMIVSYFSLVRHEPFFSRVMLAQSMIFCITFFVVFRLLIYVYLLFAFKKGVYARNIFVFGQGDAFESICKSLENHPPYKIIKKLQDDKDLEKDLQKSIPDELWYVSNSFTIKNLNYIKQIAEKYHLCFRFVPSELSLQFSKLDLEIINSVPVLHPILSSLDGWGRIVKRVMDIVIASITFIILLPFFIFIGILIKIDSRGPIFFVSTRIGKHNQPFYMYKFRSMCQDAEQKKAFLMKLSHRDGPLFKVKNDPRITKFGRFMRRFSIDELPQLLNVIKGDMSITGPRPHLPDEVAKFTIDQKRVLNIRPGITGLAQVSGRSDLGFEKEVEFDLYFIQNWSVLLDIKVMLKTVLVVIRGNGAD